MLASCTKDPDGPEVVVEGPRLVAVSPLDGTSDLIGNTLKIQFTFDQNVLCPTSERNRIYVDNGAVIVSVEAYMKDVTLLLDGLQGGKTYRVSLPKGTVSGYRDNPADEISLSFSMKEVAEPTPSDQEIDASLTNPKASAAAKKVYEFLVSQYGKKVLSGVQSGDTANNNGNVDAIAELTGKHPAVAGYDYIFLQYSPTPAGWSWVVDYGDISAAKEQWSKNGLVSFMWHWNVPTSKEAWDNGINKGDFDGYNFYCDKTKFDIVRALTPGTWENEFLLKDIEKVAGYLKLLQKEGIPVLWRPLHEAAGNYDLYGSNGAWFWWGRGGADACKQLWKLLRDKLEGEYGLDNLIWVWTLDATQGAESQYADWYPGNDLVDIVGVDIYADDTAAKTRQYKAAAALSGGRKLTTISECGNIPDPEKCLAAGEAWNWFLAWSLDQGNYKLNTDTYWKKLMSSSSVVTRESMPNLK